MLFALEYMGTSQKASYKLNQIIYATKTLLQPY